MTRAITTTTEARSINDLDDSWRIVARQKGAAWSWCIRDNELGAFRSLAFRDGPRGQPHLSTATGRVGAELVLYARVFPLKWRNDQLR